MAKKKKEFKKLMDKSTLQTKLDNITNQDVKDILILLLREIAQLKNK